MVLTSLLTAATFAVSATLLLSGVLKIARTDQTLTAINDLRVPLVAGKRWVARLVPLVEITIALGLLFFRDWAYLATAGAAVTMLAVFTVLLWNVVRREDEVDCNCFGSVGASRVTPLTVARNIALLTLAVAAAARPSASGSVMSIIAFSADQLLVIIVVLALFGALAVQGWAFRREADGSWTPRDAPDTSTQQEIDAIPDGELWTRDFEKRPLRAMASPRATLLVFLKPGCQPCSEVAPHVADLAADLEGTIDVVVASSRSVAQSTASYPDLAERMLFGAARAASVLGVVGQPAAVLLGTNGTVAAGPEHGTDAVLALVEGIRQAVALNQAEN